MENGLSLNELKKFDLVEADIENIDENLPELTPTTVGEIVNSPKFLHDATEVVNNLLFLCEKGLNSNDTSLFRVYDAHQAVLESLKEQLKREDLSSTEKQEIMDRMESIADEISKIDVRNKKYRKNFAGN